MSAQEIDREQQLADEWEEWAQEQLRRLWEIHADEIPWNDAHVDNPGTGRITEDNQQQDERKAS